MNYPLLKRRMDKFFKADNAAEKLIADLKKMGYKFTKKKPTR